MCKKISNRLSEIAPAGRQMLRREFRFPFLYLFTPLSILKFDPKRFNCGVQVDRSCLRHWHWSPHTFMCSFTGQVLLLPVWIEWLHSYAFVWFAMLYLCLDCYIISMSGLQCYTYVWFANLYLFLLYKIIPTSVMVTSVFATFDLRHVIPSSGLQYYTYICYIQFQIPWFYMLWHRLLYHLLRPHYRVRVSVKCISLEDTSAVTLPS